MEECKSFHFGKELLPGDCGNRPGFSKRNSMSSGTLGRAESRNGAELLHHAQGVPTGVGIHNLSAGDVIDGDAVHGYFLICRSDSQVFAFVRTGNVPGDD